MRLLTMSHNILCSLIVKKKKTLSKHFAACLLHLKLCECRSLSLSTWLSCWVFFQVLCVFSLSLLLSFSLSDSVCLSLSRMYPPTPYQSLSLSYYLSLSLILSLSLTLTLSNVLSHPPFPTISQKE